jgi:predicted transglutaminase-like cysteine proteinase
MRRIALLVVVTLLAFGQVAANVRANGQVEAVPRLTTSGTFPAPVGFQIFCLSHRTSCRGGGAGQVALTQGISDTIRAINAHVNARIRPADDWGDDWALDVSRGDCEDYVLAKREALIAAGLPASALRIAAATTRAGVGHAVLVVRTDLGDFVLDNLTSSIRRSDEVALHWVAMTMADGRSWARIV